MLCRILLLMWSFGPLIRKVEEGEVCFLASVPPQVTREMPAHKEMVGSSTPGSFASDLKWGFLHIGVLFWCPYRQELRDWSESCPKSDCPGQPENDTNRDAQTNQ